MDQWWTDVAQKGEGNKKNKQTKKKPQICDGEARLIIFFLELS